MIDLQQLFEPFPKEVIHWRAQTVFEKNGATKALALAYVDARDVMDRLDLVCGIEGWQSEHYDCGGGRMGCRIGIKCGEDWIWKTDGAGETDVEGKKGSFSDALKRAAVQWGVGRYLYDMKNVWVPCKATKYKDNNGKEKWRFQSFIGTPWDHVKGVNSFTPNDNTPSQADTYMSAAKVALKLAKTKTELAEWWEKEAQHRRDNGLNQDQVDDLKDATAAHAATLEKAA